MFFPDVRPWMVKPCHFVALGINPRYVRAFEDIAVIARPREIALVGFTCMLLCDDVVGLKWKPVELFRHSTIFAEPAASLSNFLSKRIIHCSATGVPWTARG